MELIFTGPGLTENSTKFKRVQKTLFDHAVTVAADLSKSSS